MTAVSVAGTAALLALAIGAPVAVASTRGADSGGVVTVDPTATATSGSAAPTDTASPAPTDSASPAPSASPSASASSTPSATPSSSSPGTPLESTPATGTLTPATQDVKVVAGTLMDPTAAFNPGGDFTDTVTYSIAPALPLGLWMSSATGALHGTAETAQAPTDYTVTADDGTVTARATITLAVVPDLRPAKVVATGTLFDFLEPTAQIRPIGFPDTVANPVTYAVEPALPKGIDIDPKTGIVSGYAITLEKATPFVITGTDGTFSAKTPLELTTTCPTVYTPQPLPDGCPALDPIPEQAGGVSPMLLAAVAASSDPVHGPLTNPTTAETCSLCHRTHSAKTPGFLGSTGPTQTALCFTCHNGTGSGADVQAQFAIAPPNVVTPTSRSFFSHDVASLATKAHQGAIVDEEAGSSPVDEFGGVLNRHAECSDCHNPHASYIKPPTTDVSTETPDGWTASGRIYATSGVKADYTALPAGAVPPFTLLDGVAQPLTAEYQLCFKCHSSYTTLPSNEGMDPTSMIYDQSVEFNPANPSFHPVTKQGTNQTTAMKNSLRNASGTQLLWNFESTDTIRCTNCHAQPSVSNADGGAGQVSAPHGSYNKYILLRRYQASTDGTSSPDSPDFDLCFGCHSKSPFVNEGSGDTNWADHYLHTWEQNLRCAECHGEIHSTTNVAGQVGNSRLMKFGPDVTALNASTPMWTPLTSAGGVQNGGTCALVCHSKRHSGGAGYSYRYTP